MAIRPLRLAVLALAAWAVLFAPGAAGIDDHGSSITDPEHVAASIVAPTFGPDSLLLSRPTRGVEDDVADPVGSAVLTVALGVAGAAVLRRADVTTPQASLRISATSLGARAPPLV